jgi:peptide deformylase
VAVLPIIEYPDPRLRRRAAPVTRFDGGTMRLADALLETLYDKGGIGLSAPQVGVFERVAVTDLSGEATDPQVYVNPEVLSRSAIGLVEESCLSVPGVVGNVFRATRVRVRAQDRQGQTFERDLDGMHAVCLQHEIDHLEGKLFIDRLWFWRRLMIQARARRQAKAVP